MIVDLLTLAALVALQQAGHVWSSRSRNSGNPRHHRFAAYWSNLTWICSYGYFTSLLIQLNGDEKGLASFFALAVVYTISAAESSVAAMSFLLRREKGSNRVGAYPGEK